MKALRGRGTCAWCFRELTAFAVATGTSSDDDEEVEEVEATEDWRGRAQERGAEEKDERIVFSLGEEEKIEASNSDSVGDGLGDEGGRGVGFGRRGFWFWLWVYL